MAELCARLKERGYILALASSKPEEMCVPICEKFGFAPSLAVIAGQSADRGLGKGRCVREAMRRLGLTEQDLPRVLMVGDRKFDVQEPQPVGLPVWAWSFLATLLRGNWIRPVQWPWCAHRRIGNVHLSH